MEKRKAHLQKTTAILAAVLIIATFFLLLNQTPWAGTSIRQVSGTVAYRENTWVLRQGETVLDPDLTLPSFQKLESGQMYSVTTTMTYDSSKDRFPYAFLHLDHMFCRVLLDGEELFSCMPEDLQKWDKSKSPGFIYKEMMLPRDSLGRELTIEFIPSLTVPIEYGLPDIKFGDYDSNLHQAILRDGPHNTIVVLCGFLGIAAILFSTAILRGTSYREGLSIGIFSLLFSLYMVTECRLNYYILGNPYYLYLLNYLAFSALPIFLMAFMRERLPDKYRKLCTAILAAEAVLFLVEVGLHFSGIYDMREVVPVIHSVYFADILLLTCLTRKITDCRRKNALILQIVPVLVGMVADAIIYWLHCDIGSNDATFSILGVIFFLLVELWRVWKHSIAIYTESARSKLYQQLAYLDELTQVGNRRAYDSEIDRIAAGECAYESMLVVSADINRLKYVNDHFGHAAGDQLIQGASKIMQEAIGSKGTLYRTGGDEFAMFLYDIPPEEFEDMLEAIRQNCESFTANSEFPMGLAVGYVRLTDHQIVEAIREADRRMYVQKAEQKAIRTD